MTKEELHAVLRAVLDEDAVVIAKVIEKGSPGVLVKRALIKTNPDGDDYVEDKVFCISIAEMRGTLPS